ncbi:MULTISPECIES: hypothetical protein [Aequorivita]|uniref:DUF1735 domain-containing protein n=1 Tax=Aequorivita iocasae TaxID=2803865 RepID=A0ABX7DN94_9FLAO|nr:MULTISPECIES: hypothetical protein [Aequorivita]QQX75408.1 hypothetical protein JK629_08580 [Aequorivita iocasae]UCA54858.1 hypothetical protein LDL78_08625 [Aequorivita sp. F7]
MKRVNILIVILTIAIIAVSCETYDDYNTDRKTVVGFVTPNKNISVPEGGSKTDSVKVFVSDLSSSDRTFTVITIPVDTLPTAPENYTFESTVTIPANTRETMFGVTAVDNSIDDTRRFFRLAIQGEADVVSGGRALIGVKN